MEPIGHVAGGLSSGLIHPRPLPFTTESETYSAPGQDTHGHRRTPRRRLGKHVGGNPSPVRISYPPHRPPGHTEAPAAQQPGLPRSSVLVGCRHEALDGDAAQTPEATEGRRIAVLGETLELGDEAVETHREVGRYAAEIEVDFVLAVGGDLAKQLTLAAGAAGVTEIGRVRDNETAVGYLGSILRPGDVVLVQAPRRGQLWQITQALTGQPITGL
ncbi:glutamate ligase domain-containing protein [Streptomyces mauvecolor]